MTKSLAYNISGNTAVEHSNLRKGDGLNINSEIATIEMQINLNKRIYSIGTIPYEMYSKANEILLARLTNIHLDDKITYTKVK